ncbi:hypothetical protein, partial [Pseudomonas amygdali]|uniref:hypothetical protein n=1 Tax=Pseudomonas amygdali TaxID=47877 RepID=UPI000AD1F6D8
RHSNGLRFSVATNVKREQTLAGLFAGSEAMLIGQAFTDLSISYCGNFIVTRIMGMKEKHG